MTNKRSRFLLLLLAVVLLALAGFIFTRNLIDFPIYYLGGRSLLRGQTNLYDPDFSGGPVMDYRYPPFFLIAFLPLWMLPYKVAAYIWYWLCVAQIGVCIWAAQKAMKQSTSACVDVMSRNRMRRVWTIALLTVGAYFVIALHYGNAHLLATALLFCAFYFAVWRRRICFAALLISLAVTIKLTPLLVLPYFAIKRQWRFLMFVCVFIAALNLAPAARFGISKNAELLKVWYEHVIVNQEFHETNTSINTSLKGQLRRYLTQVNYEQRINSDKEYPSVNFVVWPQPFVANAATACAALLFIGGLWLIRWRAPPNMPHDAQTDTAFSDKQTALLETGLMVCLMLLVSPHTWKIYYITLLWPVCALAYVEGKNKLVWRGLVLLAIINTCTPLLPGRMIQRALLVIGIDFFVLCGLTALSAYALVSRKRKVALANYETVST